MTMPITLLAWDHPQIGRIVEPACPQHIAEISAALSVLGIGSLATDRHDVVVCLRCQAHPAKLPRELLRQWYGDSR